MKLTHITNADAAARAGLQSIAPDEFDSGEIQAMLAEAEESIARDGTLDADEALIARRARRQHQQNSRSEGRR